MHSFNKGDKVYITRVGKFLYTNLREGPATVVDILLANTVIPQSTIDLYYGEQKFNLTKAVVDRLILQRPDSNSYVVMPTTEKTLACLTKL